MPKYKPHAILLEWVAMLQLDGSNCNRYWTRKTLWKAFEKDTGETMTWNSFIRTWTNLCQCNEYIHKYVYEETKRRNSNSKKIYFMVTTRDFTKIEEAPFEYDSSRSCATLNTLTVTPEQVDNNSTSIQSLKLSECKLVNAKEQPKPVPTFVRDTEVSLSKSEIELLLSCWKKNTGNSLADQYINGSFDIDFQTIPRIDIRRSHSDSPIPVHDNKHADEGTKWLMITTLARCGYEKMTKKERLILAEAVGRRESYICGYRSPFSGTTVMRWWYEFERSQYYSLEPNDTFKKKNRKKRRTYLGSIQQEFPDFLHKLYRYASKTIGHNANNCRIRSLMMRKARIDCPNCPIRGKLHITAHAFREFFINNNGYYTKISTKPRLSEAQMKERIEFCEKYSELIKDDEFYHCFLDEKWFYCSTLRKKYKILPPNYAIGETMADAYVPIPRVRSRRNPCKVMYLGIVAPPNREHKFDGKILLKRVSTMEKAKQNSHSTKRFSDDYHLNSLICESEEWKDLYVEGMPSYAIFDSIQEFYQLEDFTTDRLVLSYDNFSSTLKTKNRIHIDYTEGIREGREGKDILDRMIRTHNTA